MQFIQGIIKNSGYKDGAMRVLLERKDKTEFVAVIPGPRLSLNVGDTFKQDGFTKTEEGVRDIYTKSDNLTALDLTQEPKEAPVPVKVGVSMEELLLTGISTLLAHQTGEPPEAVIAGLRESAALYKAKGSL